MTGARFIPTGPSAPPGCLRIEQSILIEAPPERVFEVWSEVERWHQWDPDTKEAMLDGPFAVGSRGRIVPTRGRGVAMVLTECTPNRSFTVEASIPFFHMKFMHELVPQAAGTLVTHRVEFSGALKFVLGRWLGARVREGLPVTMSSLRRYVEARIE